VQFVWNNGVLEENVITLNMATVLHGGGVYLERSSPAIIGNVINHNSSTGTNSGSGIYCYSISSPVILYNEICYNNHSAVYCTDTSSPQLENNTLYGNLDYAIWTAVTSDPWGASNIITANGSVFNIPTGCSVEMTYSNVEGGYSGTGNINQQPLFVNPFADDFHLQWGSPCIDTGSPLAPPDPDATRADMGAHAFDQTTGVDPDVLQVPARFALYPAHPNPFNASTAISYELRAASFVSLKVYDTAGRLVESLVDGWRAAGTHELTFDASDLPSGIFLYRLRAKQQIAAGKLLLIK
jgi:parallel beta-helix repeat protein